jgi:hypothetical protein
MAVGIIVARFDGLADAFLGAFRDNQKFDIETLNSVSSYVFDFQRIPVSS